jgi:anti-sigma regulatory factor (Ser/Thr protein kinase)
MAEQTPMADTSQTSTLDRIDVAVPLRAQFASTLRTLAASVGADAGLSVDELDDLRLALSEVFAVLVEKGPTDGRALISIELAPGELRVSIRSDQDDVEYELDELASTILRSVTDSHEIGPKAFAFSKRSTDIVPGPVGP